MKFFTTFFHLYNVLPKDDIFFAAMDGILRHKDELQNATIYDIAEFGSVSKATISRLVKKMGYESFREFRYDMLRDFSNFDIHNHALPKTRYENEDEIFESIFSAVENTTAKLRDSLSIDLLCEITDAIHNADCVRFYYGESDADALRTNLLMQGKDVRAIPLYSEQMEDAGKLPPGSFVYLSDIIHPTSLDNKHVISKLKENDATIFMMGPESHTENQKLADYYIKCFYYNSFITLHAECICFNLLTTIYRHRHM